MRARLYISLHGLRHTHAFKFIKRRWALEDSQEFGCSKTANATTIPEREEQREEITTFTSVWAIINKYKHKYIFIFMYICVFEFRIYILTMLL